MPRTTTPRTPNGRAGAGASRPQPKTRTSEATLDLEVMTITPELAQEWLDRGGTNRKITRRRIEALAAAIERGEWRLTGEAIKLDDEGRVRDEQNRLHAIVQAGIPVRSVVARGVSEDAFDVITDRFSSTRLPGRRQANPMNAILQNQHASQVVQDLGDIDKPVP